MDYIQIESAGIYNSQISRQNVKRSDNRRTALFELELPMENGGISYIDKVAMPIKRNVLICAKPNQIRSTVFPFKCYYVHFSVGDQALSNELYSLPDRIEIEDPQFYEAMFQELHRYYATYIKRDEIMLQSLLLKIIYHLGSGRQDRKAHEKMLSGNAVNQAISYIHDNLEYDLSLKTIARSVNLSPTYFHACFKYAVGKTLREYVEETRLKRSINLMLTTDMTLTEIAYHAGFSSQSYYSSAFKRHFGCSPRMYIKQLNDRYGI